MWPIHAVREHNYPGCDITPNFHTLQMQFFIINILQYPFIHLTWSLPFLYYYYEFCDRFN